MRDPDGNEWEVFVVLQDNLPETAPCECGEKVIDSGCRSPSWCADASATAARLRRLASDGELDLPRRVIAEALGTAMLLAAVVGSGIMGERLAGGNVAIALLG